MIKNLKYILIIIFVVFVGYAIVGSKDDTLSGSGEGAASVEEEVIQVKTIRVGEEVAREDDAELVGVVKAGTEIDVISLGSGNVGYLNFDVGDEINNGQVLVRLTDMATMVSLNNAKSNYENQKNNRDAAMRLADENIRQAAINVESSRESIESARVALRSAEINYENAAVLQDKSGGDAAVNAKTVYSSYKNFIKSKLDDVNYIMDIEDDGPVLTSIKGVLGVRNFTIVEDAERKYGVAKNSFANLLLIDVGEDNVREALSELVATLNSLQVSVAAVNSVLDNTIASSDFSIADLSAQKATYYGVELEIINSINAVTSTIQGLEQIPLREKQELDGYKSQIDSAMVQLDLAKLRYSNSLASLDSSKQARDQQLVNAGSGIDVALGQLNLVETQLGYLSIKAPISGTILGRYVELGTKVNPGHKIATIAQTDYVKVEVNVNSNELENLHSGQKVFINDKYEGVVNYISPSADVSTRKVKVEILYDNKDRDLIPETFVDIKIEKLGDEVGAVERIFVPLKSVVITQNEHFVFVVGEDGAESVVEKNDVELGEIKGDSVLILKGLEVGDEIITNNVELLKVGDKVNVVNLNR